MIQYNYVAGETSALQDDIQQLRSTMDELVVNSRQSSQPVAQPPRRNSQPTSGSNTDTFQTFNNADSVEQKLQELQDQVSSISVNIAQNTEDHTLFRSDIDQVKWNNAQIFNDISSLQNAKDEMRVEIDQVKGDMKDVKEAVGMMKK